VYRAAVEDLAAGATRAGAIATLTEGGSAAIPAVLWGTTAPNSAIRKWSVALLDHSADRRCLEALIRCLSDPDSHVRRHAVHSLGCQRCKPAPLACDIIALLFERARCDPSARVRRVATHMLGCQPKDARVVPFLEVLLQAEPSSRVRTVAAWALEMHSDSPLLANAVARSCRIPKLTQR
jgi:HEAT repeat protein